VTAVKLKLYSSLLSDLKINNTVLNLFSYPFLYLRHTPFATVLHIQCLSIRTLNLSKLRLKVWYLAHSKDYPFPAHKLTG